MENGEIEKIEAPCETGAAPRKCFMNKRRLTALCVLLGVVIAAGVFLLCKFCIFAAPQEYKDFAGSYVLNESAKYVFKSSGTGELRLGESGREPFEYRLDGGILVMTFENDKIPDLEYSYQLSGDELTLTNTRDNLPLTLTRE